MSGNCEICEEHTLDCKCGVQLEEAKNNMKIEYLHFFLDTMRAYFSDYERISLKESTQFVSNWVDDRFNNLEK